MSKSKKKVPAENPDALFDRVATILDQARGNVVHAVNTNMVHAYWLIGREIVEGVQGGEARAAYGKKIFEDLSTCLTGRYGKGFSVTNLKYFRLFYQAYSDRLGIRHPAGDESSGAVIPHPAGGEFSEVSLRHPLGAQLPEPPISSQLGTESSLPRKSYPAGSQSPQGFSPQLTWSHYRALMRVDSGEFLRAKGATYDSPGQRPRLASRQHDSALKGRHNCHYRLVALSGLEWINALTPRALPWAGMNRPVGAGLIESNVEEQADD